MTSNASAATPFSTFMRSVPKPAVLVLLIPLSLTLARAKADPAWVFAVTGVAILGLISLMAKSTDQLSLSTGPVIGGLLNASFGNFPELIIGIHSIQQGLVELVKASLVGSIIGNILLTMGLAMFAGGLKFKTQRFSKTGANALVMMLVVALFALAMPSFANLSARLVNKSLLTHALLQIDYVSIYCAVVLLFAYALYLVFSLKTHADLYTLAPGEAEKPHWSPALSGSVLLVVALLVAYMSDIFVEAITGMLAGGSVFSELFMGVIFVAAIGNAVGVGVAVSMARKDKMDLAFQVSLGASLQVALLIVPLLVIAGMVIHKPLTLVFNGLELLSLCACALISSVSLLDGESNWFEGAMYVALYVLVGIVFFFHP